MRTTLHALLALIVLAGCGESGDRVTNNFPAPTPTPGPTPVDTEALEKRVYIVNALSSDMTVIDLRDPANATFLAVVPTASTPHMAAVSMDATKVYASGTLGDAISIYDAATLTKIKDLAVGAEPTHMSASPDGKYMAVCNEGTNSITFINIATDNIASVVPGMLTPHWVAFRPDSRFAYVANINGFRISIIDMASFSVVGHIFLAGHSDPAETTATEEGGFVECFIDSMGILYSAHGDSGKTMLVNTTTNTWMKEITVGTDPWVAYVSPFGGEKILVANQGSKNTTIIDGNSQTVLATLGTDGYNVVDYYTGNVVRVTTPESEVYGINFGYFGQKAYAGMRTNGAVQRIDLLTNTVTAVYSLTEGLPAQGFTQPAATTPDQRYIVFTVTSKPEWELPGANGPVNRIVIFDTETDQAVRVFDNVGSFPWSATIPHGQDYCH
jgi:DNA-binding beta-propeller fold protein YncE